MMEIHMEVDPGQKALGVHAPERQNGPVGGYAAKHLRGDLPSPQDSDDEAWIVGISGEQVLLRSGPLLPVRSRMAPDHPPMAGQGGATGRPLINVQHVVPVRRTQVQVNVSLIQQRSEKRPDWRPDDI